MKEQIVKSGKVEISRVEVIGIINKWLQENKGYRCKSMVFEGSFERVIGVVSFIEGEKVEDPYHEELQRREYPKGVTRPNYGFTEELGLYLRDLAKQYSLTKNIKFSFDEAKVHFKREFPKLTDDLLSHYLVRSDMHENAGISIILDTSGLYYGELLR